MNCAIGTDLRVTDQSWPWPRRRAGKPKRGRRFKIDPDRPVCPHCGSTSILYLWAEWKATRDIRVFDDTLVVEQKSASTPDYDDVDVDGLSDLLAETYLCTHCKNILDFYELILPSTVHDLNVRWTHVGSDG